VDAEQMLDGTASGDRASYAAEELEEIRTQGTSSNHLASQQLLPSRDLLVIKAA
jgi:hypothetical protein